MKLSFETQLADNYTSQSQKVRVLTEAWVDSAIYCPNCGHLDIDKYPNNQPVADFYCSNCKEEYELKSKQASVGAKIVDGAYRTMIERLQGSNNPNFFLLNYDLQSFESEFTTKRDKKGVPIGNLTSQILVNIYMNEMDQFIKQKLKAINYIRYADDFIVVHYDTNYLADLLLKIEVFLKKELKIRLHPGKVTIRKYCQGVDYLGYVILPKAIILRTKTKQRIFRKLKQRVNEYKKGKIDEHALMQTFNSYLGVLSHANSNKLEQEIRHKMWEWLKEN
ncbi:hypothetical protein KKB69_01085 [Patescibacteria group bacterium]|nr:hypothetical protein [Patescibacteria group bacterium]